MRRPMILACACLLAAFTSVALAADSTKDGTIKSVDATAKTFVLSRPSVRDLTFKVDDKTTFTLDGNASTFDAAVKKDLATTVTYAKVGEDRVASKVESKSAVAAK